MTVTVRVHGDYSVKLDPGCWVEPNRTVEVREEPGLDVDVLLEVRFDESAGTSLVQEVRVTRRSDGAEVTGSSLRDVRVAEFARARSMTVSARIGDAKQSHTGSMPRLVYLAQQDPTWERDADLWTARVYKWAQIGNLNPLQEVADALQVSTRTATRRIARVRELGFLPPAPPRVAFQGF